MNDLTEEKIEQSFFDESLDERVRVLTKVLLKKFWRDWKNMMKKFSTRADKWPYVFALISHIFNFLAESKILFLYHIDDH